MVKHGPLLPLPLYQYSTDISSYLYEIRVSIGPYCINILTVSLLYWLRAASECFVYCMCLPCCMKKMVLFLFWLVFVCGIRCSDSGASALVYCTLYNILKYYTNRTGHGCNTDRLNKKILFRLVGACHNIIDYSTGPHLPFAIRN